MKGLNTALGAAGLAAFLALGEVVPRVGIVKQAYFPPTSRIASAFRDELRDGTFWSALGDTLRPAGPWASRSPSARASS